MAWYVGVATIAMGIFAGWEPVIVPTFSRAQGIYTAPDRESRLQDQINTNSNHISAVESTVQEVRRAGARQERDAESKFEMLTNQMFSMRSEILVLHQDNSDLLSVIKHDHQDMKDMVLEAMKLNRSPGDEEYTP